MSERDPLNVELDELRAEVERLKAENDSLRRALAVAPGNPTDADIEWATNAMDGK